MGCAGRIGKILVSLGALVILACTIDMQKMSSVLSELHVMPLVFALLLFLSGQILSAWRFQLIVHSTSNRQISLKRSTQIHFVGLLFNQLLPSALGGDVVKGALAKTHVGLGVAVRSTILDRLCGLLVVFISIVVLLGAYQSQYDSVLITLVLGLSSAASLIFLLLAARHADFVKKNLSGTLFESIGEFLVDLRALGGARAFRGVFTSSLVIHLVAILAFLFIAWSMEIRIEPIHFFLLVPLVFLVSALPISVAGWGVRELGAVEIFALAGVPSEVSVAMSLVWGILLLVAGLPGLVLILVGRSEE